MSLRLLISRFR